MKKTLCILMILRVHICQCAVSSGSDVDVLMEMYSRLRETYYKICPLSHTCNGSIGEVPDVGIDPNRKPCCGTCYCENNCIDTYSCCPDKLQNIMQLEQDQSPKMCSLPALRKSLIGGGYAMVHTCPSHYRNNTIRELCQDTYRTNYLSLTDAAPVTEKYGRNETYFNIYCALCNGLLEDDVIVWTIKDLRCSSEYFFPDNENQLLKHIWNTQCNVYYSPSTGDEIDSNILNDQCVRYISECNFTGLWRVYDSFLDWACHSFEAPYNRTYMNIFCYMCNEVQEPNLVCYGENDVINVFTSFSAILNFAWKENSMVSDTTDVANKTDQCPEGFVYDKYQMKCLKFHCAYGRIYKNGTCVDGFVENSFGHILIANIRLTPQAKFSTEYLAVLTETIFDTVITFPQSLPNGRYQRFETCETKLYYETDGANNASVSHIYFELVVRLKYYTASFYIEDILQLHRKTARFGNISVDFYLELYAPKVEEVINDYISRTRRSIILSSHTTYTANCNLKSKNVMSRFYIKRGMRCPLIELNMKEFEWNIFDFGLYISKLDLLVSRADLMQINNASVHICADVYISRANDVATLQHNASVQLQSVNPVGYLTITCAILSVSCLAATLVTYLFFPNLRNQPGVNNIILCFTLLIAQGLFQFGIGAKEEVSDMACVLFGILIHFCWLFAIFWMNVCSVHMARVFRSLRPQHMLQTKTKRSLVYIAYAFLPSSFFPFLNILISHSATNGHSLGYADSKECYISSSTMLGFTFAIPVGVVVVMNVILFLFTVCQICSVPEVARLNHKSRSFLLIYARLSTITGLAWIFGFLYALTGVVALDYVFAVLNAGQGVFIMIAFVMNKRVREMYKKLLCKPKKPLIGHTEKSIHVQEQNYLG